MVYLILYLSVTVSTDRVDLLHCPVPQPRPWSA